MNPDGPDKTFETSVREAMAALPAPVRNYLAGGKYVGAAKTLSVKYGLRVDQAGVLERELMLLVLGAEEPDDFLTALKAEAGISDEQSRAMLADINQQIFVPLRNEMMKGATPAAVPAASAPRPAAPVMPSLPRPAPQPVVRQTPPPPAAPVPRYQPPVPAAPVFNQSPVPPAPSGLRAALQSVAPKEAMAPAAPVAMRPPAPKPPVPAAVPGEHPGAPLPPKVILPGARPQISLRPAPSVQAAASAAETSVPAPAPVAPALAAPVAPRPGHPLNLLARQPEGGTPLTRDASRPPVRPIEVVPARPVPPPETPEASVVPQTVPVAPAPAPKAAPAAASYPVDPYREPIE